jgi:phage baseplate assembly protein W
MAYGIKNISPLDLRASTGIGVSIPFESPSAFNTVYNTKDQLKYNLINFLLTDKYERPQNPNFGCGLRLILFEQINQENFDQIKLKIASQVKSNFPNIEVQNIDILSNIDDNSINIKFFYTILNTNETDTVTIAIQNTK